MKIATLLTAIQKLPGAMCLKFDGESHVKVYRHTFRRPAVSNIGMELVKLGIFECPELAELYSITDGCRLFHSRTEKVRSGEYFIPSVTLYPLKRLAAETAYMQALIDDEAELLDYCAAYAGGVAIGEAAGTGNRFVYMKRGEFAGQIIYADRDPDENEWHERPFASSLTNFLAQLARPPHRGIANLCGADKITFTQGGTR